MKTKKRDNELDEINFNEKKKYVRNVRLIRKREDLLLQSDLSLTQVYFENSG